MVVSIVLATAIKVSECFEKNKIDKAKDYHRDLLFAVVTLDSFTSQTALTSGL